MKFPCCVVGAPVFEPDVSEVDGAGLVFFLECDLFLAAGEWARTRDQPFTYVRVTALTALMQADVGAMAHIFPCC